MNFRMVGKYLGHLIFAEALFLLPSVLVAVLYHEVSSATYLLMTAGLCLCVSTVLWFLCHSENSPIYAREGFVVAGGGWLLVSLFGALPFYFSGEIPSLINAFFESASGFTTTGASILLDVEALPKSLLFWRSFTHWLGGIGVLAFVLALVRGKGGAGFTLHLLRAESPGPQVGKILPRMQDSVRALFWIYGGLSLINLLFLLAGGMPVFDAFCTMFGTAGTGGFGIKGDSMASYSPYLQNVTTVFMALFGVNFTLYYLALRREWRSALKDEELRLYIGIIVASIAVITGALVLSGWGSAGQNLQHSAFAVTSIMTTTGYTTVNFDAWPSFCHAVLLLLMICGAMAGSTGGGFKVIRLLILFKSMRAGLHRLLHPRSVKKVRINGKTLEEEVASRTYLFLAVYCALVLVGVLLISIDGLTLETNISAVLSCVNNIGPGLAQVGPADNFALYSPFSTLVLSFLMLLGRLEIFPILLLFSPSTWRRKA